ncbi:hypothetical protein DIPPA_17779 [Diplonema papillatum]|nr:hypothetical protein DIPPA_17779 [Diplonema papillatum]
MLSQKFTLEGVARMNTAGSYGGFSPEGTVVFNDENESTFYLVEANPVEHEIRAMVETVATSYETLSSRLDAAERRTGGKWSTYKRIFSSRTGITQAHARTSSSTTHTPRPQALLRIPTHQ